MLCFRVIFWGAVFIAWIIPAIFFFGIFGRLTGFRQGPKQGDTARVFSWIGIFFFGTLMLGICVGAGFIDYTIATIIELGPENVFALPNIPQPGDQEPPIQPNLFQPIPIPKQPIDQPKIRPIPPEWVDANMKQTFLSDMQEFNARVGWGKFAKKGVLGYPAQTGEFVLVNGLKSPNALSMVPHTFGSSTVSYRLGRTAKLFRATAALNDLDHPNHQPQSLATFKVLGDGMPLWSSNPIGKDVTQECRLNVEGVDVLELQVHCPGSCFNVRAVWLEPNVLR